MARLTCQIWPSGPASGAQRDASSGSISSAKVMYSPNDGYRAAPLPSLVALPRFGLGAPAIAFERGNGPRLDGRNLMGTLMVDFITSLDGYGAAEGWPGWWGMESPEYLGWLGEQPEYTV
jgi:hypothetical protein